MKKVLIIISVIFLILAALMLVATLSSVGWDFSKLSHPAITNTHEIDEDFNGISISVKTADVTFIATNESRARIVCNEAYRITNSVRVEHGVLKIETRDERRWYEMLSIIPVNFKITVFLPSGEWDALSIRTSTGDAEIPDGFSFTSIDIKQSTGNITLKSSATGHINLETSTGNIAVSNISARALAVSASTGDVNVGGATADSLTLKASTGDITASNISVGGKITANSSTGKQVFTNIACKALESEADTGDTMLNSVIVEGRLSVERSTGDVKLDSSDAAEIFIETDTGDVKGTLLSDKIFITHTDTGDIDVPRTTSGGRCEITTDTGDIKISIK